MDFMYNSIDEAHELFDKMTKAGNLAGKLAQYGMALCNFQTAFV